MNYSQHVPMYKITYKSTIPDDVIAEWIVCEECFGKQEFFDESEKIESITSLHGNGGQNSKFDHFSSITGLAKQLNFF